MKLIEGFVCIGRIKEQKVWRSLFGPKTKNSSSPYSYMNFLTNGLVPFADVDSAADVLVEMRRRRYPDGERFFKQTWLAEIDMKIAESCDFDDSKTKVPDFIGRKDLIIVGEADQGDFIFLGRQYKGLPGVAYAPVSYLEENGFRTLAYNQVFTVGGGNALAEVTRQGHLPAHPAIFRLRRLNSSLYLKGLT